MSDEPKMKPGEIVWRDIAVPDAAALRDFYCQVVGWASEGLDMGGYEDYVMVPPGSADGVAGVCHARGENAGLPPQWLIYIAVADLDESIRSCERLGGEIVHGPRALGSSRFCVVRDPVGAVCGLIQASG